MKRVMFLYKDLGGGVGERVYFLDNMGITKHIPRTAQKDLSSVTDLQVTLSVLTYWDVQRG